MFVRDGRLTFVVNAAGDISRVVAEVAVPTGVELVLGCSFVPGPDGGTYTLTHGDTVVGRARSEYTMPLTWQHGGALFRIGRDDGFPVCDDYAVPFPWTGTIREVVVEVPGPTIPDPEVELTEALRRD